MRESFMERMVLVGSGLWWWGWGGTRPVWCAGWGGGEEGRESGRWSCVWFGGWRGVCLGVAAGACAVNGASEHATPKGKKRRVVVAASRAGRPISVCEARLRWGSVVGWWGCVVSVVGGTKDKDKDKKDERPSDNQFTVTSTNKAHKAKIQSMLSSNRAPIFAVLLQNGRPSSNG